MDQKTLFPKLKQHGWTDDDLCMLIQSVKYDQKIDFEPVIDVLGHFAEHHDNLIAAEALSGLLKFTVHVYRGLQSARFVINKPDEETNDKVSHYVNMAKKAEDLCASLAAKHKLVKSLREEPAMECKGHLTH